jgi:hypothetical protein
MRERPDITGSSLLTDLFGHWPGFHDAEVLRLRFEAAGDDGPALFADIYAFEMTSDVAPSGQYVLKNHVVVSFRFSGIDNLEMRGFNEQNAIMGLSISNIRAQQMEGIAFEVKFEGSFGVSAKFVCRDVAVEAVRPWSREGGFAV